MPVDFNYFLNQKYAQLQQQADATTQNAASQAAVSKAAAGLDIARTGRIKPESIANIANTNASTGLLGAQTYNTNEATKIIAPESVARIAGMNAGTSLTNTQNKALQLDAVEQYNPVVRSAARGLGLNGTTSIGTQPTALAGPRPPVGSPGYAAWLDQTNGL